MAPGLYGLHCVPGRGWVADRDGLEGNDRTVLRNYIGCRSYENPKLLRCHIIAWCNESVWQVTQLVFASGAWADICSFGHCPAGTGIDEL